MQKTVLNMILMGWQGHKTSTQKKTEDDGGP